jgi:hypothetical protein
VHKRGEHGRREAGSCVCACHRTETDEQRAVKEGKGFLVKKNYEFSNVPTKNRKKSQNGEIISKNENFF